MKHSLNKIFQKVMVYTKVSITMFFSIPKLVPRALYLFSILSWILIHYCLADLPLFFFLKIATVRIDLLKERATNNLSVRNVKAFGALGSILLILCCYRTSEFC